MPSAPKRPCRSPGCANLADGSAHVPIDVRGYCHACAPEAAAVYASKVRRSSQRRRQFRDKFDVFYAKASWRRCRDAFIKANPLCAHCDAQGRLKPADLVDHIVERRDGGADYDHSNLQSLCHQCHQKKTSDERNKRATTKASRESQ